MERELKLGDKRIVLQDPNGALVRTIDTRSGRPVEDTSQDGTIEAVPRPPEGFPDATDPLGVAHAEGQLYGAIYQGKLSPTTFLVSWLLSLSAVCGAVVVLLDQEWSTPLRYAAAALVVLADGFIFWHIFRRMRVRRDEAALQR